MPTSVEERHRIIHIHKNVPGVLKVYQWVFGNSIVQLGVRFLIKVDEIRRIPRKQSVVNVMDT